MTRRGVAALVLLLAAGCSTSTAQPAALTSPSPLPSTLRSHVITTIPTARHVVRIIERVRAAGYAFTTVRLLRRAP